jgi:hypothetical protein
LLDQSFRDLSKDPSLQELTRVALIRFIKSRNDPAIFSHQLLSDPSLNTSSLILNLIRSHPEEFTFLREDTAKSGKYFAEECLVCEGSQLQWLDDYQLVATWTCPSSGSFFGGGRTAGVPVRVFDVQSGVCLGELGTSLIVPVLSPDRHHLLIAGTEEVSVWTIKPVKLQTQISATDVEIAVFSPSGDKLLTVSNIGGRFDLSARKISIWETKTGVELQQEILTEASFVAASQDGSKVAVFQKDHPGTLLVWDFESGTEVARIDASFLGSGQLAWASIMRTIRFSTDGTRLYFLESQPTDNSSLKFFAFREIDLQTNQVLRAGPWKNIVGWFAGIVDKLSPLWLKSVVTGGKTEWEVTDLDDPDFACRIDFASPLHPLNSFLAANQDLEHLNLQFLTRELLWIKDGDRQIVLDLSTNQLDLPMTNEMVGIANHRRVHDLSIAWSSKQGTMIRNTETNTDEKWPGLQSDSILSFIDLESGPIIALQRPQGIQIVRFHSLQTLFRGLK